jgi:TonB-linked SusC/RagA family outer membrane protein
MNRKISKLITGSLFIVFWTFSISIFAQRITVNGRVTDATNEPLIGVTIKIVGTTTGTITNIDGNFTLFNVPPEGILEVSYVGMITQTIPINGRTFINITLQEDSEILEEVVVVGYGSQKKESITGAISSVDVEKLKQTSSVSLSNALAGRISGLSAVTGSGRPGFDDATIYLRGISTFNNAAPLILIDGVPREDIRQIHPDEIASISVLKDAAATAVFGVRGANGALIITTRRGEEGKGKLNISMEQGYSSFTREPERLHSVEYFQLRNEAAVNSGLEPLYSENIIDKYRNPLAGLDPRDPDYEKKKQYREYIYPDNDYFRLLISRYTPQTMINANYSGGTQKVSYYMHAGYIYQGGNFNTLPESVIGYDPAIKMNRFNFRANLDYKIHSSFSTFLNLSSSLEQANMPSPWRYGNDTNVMILSILQDAKGILPWSPGPTTIEGFGVEPGQTIEYPYLENKSAYRMMSMSGFRNETRAISNSSLGFNWDLGKLVTPGLKINGMISFDSWATNILQGNASFPYYNANVHYETDELSYILASDEEIPLSLNKSGQSRYTMNLQGRINYERLFGKHNIGGMILAQRDYWESYNADIPFNILGVAGRATYDYDNRYFAEINIGYNGSEQFAPKRRFGFFPAASLGWVISNENFLKDNNIIDFLKIRGSYGKSGNDKISSDRFLFQDNITLAGGGPLGSLGRGQYINMGLLGNPNISWEVSLKKNIGFDLNLLKSISASFDYFLEDRTDILLIRGLVPVLAGVPLENVPRANIGEVENHGFDIELKYNKRFSRDFSLNVSANFGHYKNKVIYADEPIRDETYAHRYRTTGYSLGQQWGYKIDWSSNGGYWISQEEIDNSNLTYDFGTPRPGDFKYIDQNNDGVINDKDQVPIGYSNRNPGIIYGATLSAAYKGVDFMVFFQGVGNYSDYYSGIGVWENNREGTYMGYHKQAWTKERFENNEKITYPALSIGPSTNHTANDFFIMDRSYTRLRNIELGYTFTKGKLLDLGINNMRLYAGGQNLFTWENLRGEQNDPESENRQYPITKIINFGLEINF